MPTWCWIAPDTPSEKYNFGLTDSVILLGSNATLIHKFSSKDIIKTTFNEDDSIKENDYVKIGTEIGKASYDDKTKKNKLHFEIWNGENALNPEDWLKNYDLQ